MTVIREYAAPAFAELADHLAEAAEVQPTPATVLSLAIEHLTRQAGVAATALALRRAADWLDVPTP